MVCKPLLCRSAVEGGFTYDQLSAEILADYKVIVNASPVGTFPKVDACPAIPYEFLTEDHLLYDLVYNPAETLFLKKGKERGAAVLNGESMLTGQAIAAWKVWNE
jgi:shikimate dehydrogenase